MYDGQVTRVGLGKAYGPNAVRTQSIINGRTYNVDYGHLSKSLVLAGDKVSSGTSVIGYMGRAGIPSYAPTHVHIAVWRPLPNGLMGFVVPHF
jgi:murein DD-endopeptidase MepM/ murein hydrolase activator NlpD